ncbi:carbamoyl phosphate synthase large subunit, partial [Escherichia coli]|nr:carbamoyl phosphate synthase large subunit [Escherichia coli]
PDTLTTQKKSVGEVMAIGSNFQESLQKAIRGLEIGRCGLHSLFQKEDMARLRGHLREPTPDRLWYIADAFRQNLSLEEIHLESRVDPWFLAQIQELVLLERSIIGKTIRDLDKTTLHLMKHRGFADAYLAKLLGCTEAEVRAR